MHRLLVLGATALLALASGGQALAWSWPADGAVLRPFQLGADAYAGGQHRGVDIGGPEGSSVRAPASGTVTFAGSVSTYGRGVTISTADGYSVTLVHLGSLGVAKGETVAEGAVVGLMGSSGEPEHDVPSVHLGIRRSAEAEGYVDPLGLLPARPAPPATVPAPVPTPAPAPVPAPPTTVSPPTAPPLVAPPVATPTPPVAPPSPSAQPVVEAPRAPPVAAAPGLVLHNKPGGSSEPSSSNNNVLGTRSSARSSQPENVLPRRWQVVSEARVASPDSAVATLGATRALGALTARPARMSLASTGTVESPRPSETARVAAAGKRRHAERAPDRRGGLGPEPVKGLVAAAAVVSTSGERAVVPRGGELRPPADAVADTEAVSPSPPTVDNGLRPAPLAAAIALVILLAGAVVLKTARRIGGHGALLPDDADLLRQRDPAHRARVHDGGRRHPRQTSAATRP